MGINVFTPSQISTLATAAPRNGSNRRASAMTSVPGRRASNVTAAHPAIAASAKGRTMKAATKSAAQTHSRAIDQPCCAAAKIRRAAISRVTKGTSVMNEKLRNK
jgi:hypothetical protein